MLQAGRSRVRFPMSPTDISVYLILPTALWPTKGYSPSNRNEYQDLSGAESGRRVRFIISLSSVSRLSRKCGSLDVWKSCGPSRPAAGYIYTRIHTTKNIFPATVAAWSKARKEFLCLTLDRGFEYHSRHGCLYAYSLWLCWPWDGLISCSRNPTKCL
jgi:hypothetical protein